MRTLRSLAFAGMKRRVCSPGGVKRMLGFCGQWFPEYSAHLPRYGWQRVPTSAGMTHISNLPRQRHSFNNIFLWSYNPGVTWNVEYTDEFGKWWGELTATEQESVAASVRLLEERGPNLGFSTAAGSRARSTAICVN